MFTRQPASGSRALGDINRVDKTLEGRRPATTSTGTEFGEPGREGEAKSGPPPIGTGRTYSGRAADNSSISIIGNDLTIAGENLRIVTRGTLQVEGNVTGDVVGNEVVIGEKGRVAGVVSGQNVEVLGEVFGTIKGLRVALRATARVEGDVHHQELTVEPGAVLEGQVRRPQDPSSLTPQLE